MVRIEEGANTSRILEALIAELIRKGTLDQSTADNIIKEGRRTQ